MTPKNNCANCKWFFADPNRPGQGACGELESVESKWALANGCYIYVSLGLSYCDSWKKATDDTKE